MSQPSTFRLPDVGEGLTEAEIVSWKVKAGDAVVVNQPLVEIETAKSLVELPSPYAGTVAELLVHEGVTVPVGTPIIAVQETGTSGTNDDGAAGGGNATAAGTSGTNDDGGPAASVSGAPSDDGAGTAATPALVGSGPRADSVKRRARRRPLLSVPKSIGKASAGQGQVPTTVGPEASVAQAQQPVRPLRSGVLNALGHLRPLAKPPVRKSARDLGIRLEDVKATGARGEVTRKDLISYQAQREAEVAAADTFWEPPTKPQKRRTERIKVRGVRKSTAKAMVQSAFTAPHVSIFVDVDASRTMEFVQRLKASRDFEGIRVSPLLILARAVIWAAARNPSVNATWTDEEIIVKHFMNLGIAAATPRGLLVPNIKDAQDLSLKELAVALNELASKARAGKTEPADMRDGTLTITNIGALGIDTGTPILNPGEVAIVAFGTIKQKPWVVDGEVVPRWVTTLGGSFDHRVVDGDLSARFMADVASILEEPALLLD